MPIGVHDGDDDRALFQLRQLDRIRPAHLEHDIGAGQRIAGDGGAGGGIVGVEDAGFNPGARFEGDLGAKADHFLTVSGVAATRGSPESVSATTRLSSILRRRQWPAISRCRYLRLDHVRKYAIPITMMTTIAIVTFTSVMKFR